MLDNQCVEIIQKNIGRNWLIDAVTLDSRQVKAGSLFFALKGSQVDGRQFIQDVINLGGFAVCDLLGDPSELPKSDRIVIVPNVHKVICSIISDIRSLMRLVIAVTGSSGKTFTTDAIFQALKSSGAQVYTPGGNYNTEYGIFLALVQVTQNINTLVLELGVSKPGDMDVLARTVKPDMSIILPISMAHVENFKDREELIKEKTKLINYTRGKVVVHESLKALVKGEIVPYPHTYTFYQNKDEITISGILKYKGKEYILQNPELSGLHLVENMLGAITLLENIVDIDDLIIVFNNLHAKDGRGKFTRIGGITIYDSSYNANGGENGSMLSELRSIHSYEGDIIIVLGGMAECGEFSTNEHKRVLQYAETLTEKILLIGENWPECRYKCATLEEISAKLLALVSDKCLIMVKGSRKFQLDSLVAHLKLIYV